MSKEQLIAEQALLDRELEDYRKNPNDVVPWDEVKARLRRDREQADKRDHPRHLRG
jgi:putative addiction module component (TIGR02574 family)